MAPPFPIPPGTLVTKVEDGEQATTDQELRDMFTKNVQRRLELMRRIRRALQPSGIVQSQPPPAPPAQQAPLSSLSPLPPPPPTPPPPQHPCAKRPAIGPPPGFAHVRTPPLKHYQRRPPKPMAPAPQPPRQPAPPNAHHSLAPPAPDAQRAVAAGAATMSAPPVPMHAAGPIVMPVLQRRAAPKPKPKPPDPAAKKKPTTSCTFCGVLCMTAWHLKQHEQGRKHRNRVAYLAGEMNVQCSVCNVHLSGGLNIQQHNAGKQHLMRLHNHSHKRA